MNLKQYALSFSLCLAMLAVAADATGQVYRWVDENGVVHYGDRAPQGVEATLVGVKPNTVPISRPEPKAPTAEGATEAGADEAEPLSYAEQRRRERAERREEYAAAERERNANCNAMRSRKAYLEPSPRVLVEDEDGEVRRLDDEERLRLLDEANAYLAENCDPD